MRRWGWWILAVLLAGILTWLTVRLRTAAPAMMAEADLEGDGRVERVILQPARDPTLSVCREGRCLWRGVPQRWQPWHLAVADVDGDRRQEIAVGVYKSTRFFPQPHNCLFIYSWDGRQASPKWLGSSLAQPFSVFAFANLDSDPADELVALETRPDGLYCVAIYSWRGFGFEKDREWGGWHDAHLMESSPGEILITGDGAVIAVRR